jgi:hypothetical protein
VSDIDELLERAQRASRRLHGMTIRGEGWSGDARRGFIFNPEPVIGESGEGAGGFTGACCIGEACSILSAADCAAAGGVYQGDFTPCFPNPCATTMPPCCPGSFEAFDGSGRKFLTRTWVGSFSDHCGDCTADGNAVRTDFYDPDDCGSGLFCECSGTVEDSIRGSASTDVCNGFLDPYSGDLGSPSWQDSALLPCLRTGGPTIGCGAGVASLVSDSATERIWNFSFPGCADGSGSLTVTLSDECTPV